MHGQEPQLFSILFVKDLLIESVPDFKAIIEELKNLIIPY